MAGRHNSLVSDFAYRRTRKRPLRHIQLILICCLSLSITDLRNAHTDTHTHPDPHSHTNTHTHPPHTREQTRIHTQPLRVSAQNTVSTFCTKHEIISGTHTHTHTPKLHKDMWISYHCFVFVANCTFSQ